MKANHFSFLSVCVAILSLMGSSVQAQTATPVYVNPGETINYAAGATGDFLTVQSDGSANRGILVFNNVQSSYTGGLIIEGAEVRLARSNVQTTIPGTITVGANSVLRFMQSDPVGYYDTPTGTISINGGTVTTGDNAGYHITLRNLEFTNGTLTSNGPGTGKNYVIDGSMTINAGASEITAAAIQFRKRIAEGKTGTYGENGGPIFVDEGGTLRITSNITHFGTMGTGANETDTDVALIKTGAGLLTLEGNNTLPLTVSGGKVVRAAGQASGLLTLNSGTEYVMQGGSRSAGITVMEGASLAVHTGGQLTSGGDVRLAGGLVAVKDNNLTWSRPTALDADTDSTIAIDPGLTVSFTNVASGAGALTVTSDGSANRGILTMNQQNTFTGGLTIDGAEVQIHRGGQPSTVPGIITVMEHSVLRLMAGDALGYYGTGTEEIKILGGTVTASKLTPESNNFHATLPDLTFQNGTLDFESGYDGVGYIVDGLIHVLPDDGGTGSFIKTPNLNFRNSAVTARRSAAESLGGKINVDDGGKLTISSKIANGGGNPVVTKQGLGELILTDNNALPVSVEQGTLSRTAGTESNNVVDIGTKADQAGVYNLSGTGVINNGNLTLRAGYYGTGTLNVNDGVNLTAGTLNIGDQSGSTGYVNVSDNAAGSGSTIAINNLNVGAIGTGTMTVGENNTLSANTLAVGATGKGTMTVGRNNTITPGTIIIGSAAGSDGSMTLGEGSTLTTGNTLVVGDFGKGELTVNGGTLNLKEINVGKASDAVRTGDGTLNLINTTVTTMADIAGGGRGYFFVGEYGKGTVVQDGGSVTMNTTSGAHQVYIADRAGAGSSYTLKGDGTLTTYGIVVGQRAEGHFTQESGTISIANRLIVGGDGSGSGTGTYTMEDGTLMTPLLEVGRGSTFTMNGGDVFARMDAGNKVSIPNLNIVNASKFNIHGGDVSATTLQVSGVSTFNMSGGTIAVGEFFVGNTGGSAESPNVLNISGGEILSLSGDGSRYFRVGNNGVGELNQTGGSITLTSTNNSHSLYIADRENGAGSAYTISDVDGPASLATRLLVVGQRGAGSFTHNGGTVTAEHLYVGYDDGGDAVKGVGTYTLSGGTLTSPTVTVRNNSSEFVMNGGTLRTLRFNGSLANNGGVLDLANAPGTNPFNTVTINGDYTQGSDGTLSVGVMSDDGQTFVTDLLKADSISLDGTLDLIFSGAYAWTEADVGQVSFSIFDGMVPGGEFSDLSWSGAVADNLMWWYNPLDGTVNLALGANEGGGVPEPATWIMLLVGLAGLAIWRKRGN